MMAPSDMTGRVALVTGAAAGLGRASAVRLAEVGADLALVDIAEAGLDETAQAIRAMGRKALVPYGLYRASGFFNPHFARQTGATPEDLALFWTALVQAWDLDRSSSRGLMACRGLYVFSHDSNLGNAPAHRLFDLIETPKSAVAAPRSFADYAVTVRHEAVPAGVTLSVLEG